MSKENKAYKKLQRKLYTIRRNAEKYEAAAITKYRLEVGIIK